MQKCPRSPIYSYLSTDGGATWTAQTSLGDGTWAGTALSDDGSKRLLANSGSYILTSINGGTSYVTQTTAGARNWYRATMGSDGTTIAIPNYGGYIYTATCN